MTATLLPLRSVIEVLDDELASADDQFATLVADDAVVKRLTTLAEHRADHGECLCRRAG